MSPPALSLFVYGTLRDPRVRAAVLGREPAPADLIPARAVGWRAVHYPGEVYPALVPKPDSSAQGLVIASLDAADMARLDAYEGDQYRRGPITVRTARGTLSAEVYFPVVGIAPDTPAWTLEAWRETRRAAGF